MERFEGDIPPGGRDVPMSLLVTRSQTLVAEMAKAIAVTLRFCCPVLRAGSIPDGVEPCLRYFAELLFDRSPGLVLG